MFNIFLHFKSLNHWCIHFHLDTSTFQHINLFKNAQHKKAGLFLRCQKI